MSKIGVGYHRGVLGTSPSSFVHQNLPDSFYGSSYKSSNPSSNPSSFMNPLGIVSAGASLGSSLFNIFTQNSRNKAAAREQRLENERNRNFQREMAELSFQRNIEQWNRENEYNSPLEQRKRLQAAGLNADLFYGSGAGNMMSADSPTMFSPSGGGAPASGAVGRGIPEFDTLAIERARAEIENIKADTVKKESEGELTAKQVQYADDLLSGQVNAQNVSIRYNESLINLTEDQRKVLAKDIEQIDERINLMKQQRSESLSRIQNMNADSALKYLEYQFQSVTFKQRVANLAAKYNLDMANARYLCQLAETALVLRPEQLQHAKIQNLLGRWQSHLSKANLNLINVSAGKIAFDLKQGQKWDDIQRGFNMATDAVKTAAQAYVGAKGGAWIDFKIDKFG